MAILNTGVENPQIDSGEISQGGKGPLIDNMQTGLNAILGIEHRIAGLEAGRQALIEGSMDLDEAEWALGEVAHILSPEGPEEQHKPRAISEFLQIVTTGEKAVYAPGVLKQVGLLGVLIGAEGKLIEKAQESWASDPETRRWVGRAVTIQRPPAEAIREDPNWGGEGFLYRGFDGEQYGAGGPYRGGERAGFNGRITGLSLENSGTIRLSYGEGEGVEITELFEPVKDESADVVTHFVPRVSIETVNLANRAKRALRQAAIERLGPDLA